MNDNIDFCDLNKDYFLCLNPASTPRWSFTETDRSSLFDLSNVNRRFLNFRIPHGLNREDAQEWVNKSPVKELIETIENNYSLDELGYIVLNTKAEKARSEFQEMLTEDNDDLPWGENICLWATQYFESVDKIDNYIDVVDQTVMDYEIDEIVEKISASAGYRHCYVTDIREYLMSVLKKKFEIY